MSNANSKVFWPYLFIILALMLSACTSFPKDPEHSFENARRTALKVGIALHHPFTIHENGQIKGTEVTLIENFARKNDLKVAYTIASESQLVVQLETYQLHLVAGGIDKKTIWVSKAGLSISYDQKHVLLVPKGENQLLYKLEQYILSVR